MTQGSWKIPAGASLHYAITETVFGYIGPSLHWQLIDSGQTVARGSAKTLKGAIAQVEKAAKAHGKVHQ